MSIILDALVLKPKLSARSKQVGPKTSTILLISLVISISIVLLTSIAVVYTEGLRQF